MGLKIVTGDLWDFHERGYRVVVTTNIGWDPVTFRNNMGAGAVCQAMQRWPDLPVWYGHQCASFMSAMPVIEHEERRLIFLPVKPLLDVKNPERSWNQVASLDLIATGLRELADLVGNETLHVARGGLHTGNVTPTKPPAPIAMSFPGCGNGALTERQVRPLMERLLPQDGSITVVRWVME